MEQHSLYAPLDDREFEGQWECALEFIAPKQRRLSWQNDIGFQISQQSITAEKKQQEQNSHSVSELAEEIMSRYESLKHYQTLKRHCITEAEFIIQVENK